MELHSNSVVRGVGWYFSFSLNLNRTFCKQRVETLIRSRIVQRLVWACTIWLRPTKKDVMLICFCMACAVYEVRETIILLYIVYKAAQY